MSRKTDGADGQNSSEENPVEVEGRGVAESESVESKEPSESKLTVGEIFAGLPYFPEDLVLPSATTVAVPEQYRIQK